MKINNIEIRLEKKKSSMQLKILSERISGMYIARGAWSILCFIN